MKKRKPIIKRIDNIPFVPTAHNIGTKQPLLTNDETPSAITQIANAILLTGEKVEPHTHLTMDEHYIITQGEGLLYIDNQPQPCCAGTFILIPAGTSHAIEATQELHFITIGVAI